MTLTLKELTETTKWIVVKDGNKEVFRASQPGHTRRAVKECERFIAAQKYNMDFYKESAERVADLDTWIVEAKARTPKGPRSFYAPQKPAKIHRYR